MKLFLSFFLLQIGFVVEAKTEFDFSFRMEVDYSLYEDDFTYFKKDGINLRRFRGDVFAKFNDKFSLYYQTDISDYESRPIAATQAAWLRYRVNRQNEIYLGKMEMPFSLESVSNSKYHFFMERSLASALTDRFGIGVNYIHYGETWNLRFGVFGNDHYHLGSSKNYGQSLTTKIGKEINFEESNIYVGASYQYRKPEDFLRFRTKPESQTYGARLLDTDELYFVSKMQTYGIEGLWQKNNWTLQTEYIGNQIQREFGGDLSYQGGYFIVSKIFNGKRRFNYRKGEWRSTRTEKYKTWEVSARYSFLDLNSADLSAGKETNYSLGLNYYIDNKSRVMFNAIRAKATPNSSGVYEDLDIYQLRFQFEL